MAKDKTKAAAATKAPAAPKASAAKKTMAEANPRIAELEAELKEAYTENDKLQKKVVETKKEASSKLVVIDVPGKGKCEVRYPKFRWDDKIYMAEELKTNPALVAAIAKTGTKMFKPIS